MNVLSAGLDNYCYQEVRTNVKLIVDPTPMPRDVQSSQAMGLVASMFPLAFDYRNGMITATWPTKCNTTYSSKEYAIEKEGDRKTVKKDVTLILSDRGHRRSLVDHCKPEGKQE